MQTRAKEHKADLIEAIVRQVHDRLSRDDAPVVENFVRQYYAGVAPDDFVGYTGDNLYGEALTVWRFAQKRTPGTPKIRVFNPVYEEHGWQSTHTVVEIVNDDMPFLVDSVAADLNRHNLTIHLLIHPLLKVRRGRDGRLLEVLPSDSNRKGAIGESILHVEVNQQPSQRKLDEIRESLERVLVDVRRTVEDWRPTLAKVTEVIEGLTGDPPPLAEKEIAEAKAFLEWIRDNNFTFLGFREYELEHKDGKDYLRLNEKTGLGVLRNVLPESRKRSRTPLSAAVGEFARKPRLLVITKANTRATVHRPVYMDYVGIKRFDAKGNVTGERRFLGLFTSAAYNRSPREIPILRDKVDAVVGRSPFPPSSHNGKALLHILESYPRDELFQTAVDDLYEVAHGILHLEERQRIRLFMRRDEYARFFSCLIYVPRERYNTSLRKRMQDILVKALGGTSTEFTAQVSEAVMARLHFIIHIRSGDLPDYDEAELEERLVGASRLWTDDLADACVERWGEGGGMALYDRYQQAFPPAFTEDFSAQTAVSDIEHIEALDRAGQLGMNLYNRVDAPEGVLHFKVYHPKDPVPLSDILPMLENMGLKVIEEAPYFINPPGEEHDFWIHDFSMVSRRGGEIEIARVKEAFQDAFDRIWRREVEDDGFNALVLSAGLTWREVAVLRAYCKYLRQAAITFSQDYMEETLGNHPHLAKTLVELFRVRFDPAIAKNRDARAKAIVQAVEDELEGVANLDEDRIIRRFLNLVRSTIRTNYYQPAADGAVKPYMSFKLDSEAVDELPLPRPWREIFVYSPRVEAVHLRGGAVARGGLRWSDRREDFRTEVLGLMKAQMVKNAVIVPVGAKGGFVVKRPPAGGDREALMDEVVACYKTLISGMLDVTDNLVAGKVVPPADVVLHDGDDPYLVVAADKGTATFSDIANGVAIDYGFWLGDAFASGGSAGYDHKAMGITARGAWESVKRHFREMGIDCQTTDFTCVGIGDMAGDVFGNGMLLSRHIRLIGAFNHMHIFVDPDPDAAKSFAERERLFALPRSTWEDYDKKLIAKGGGVFDRRAKSIKVTPEMKRAFDIAPDSVTPNELIRAMLLAPVDLLWNGGIGTYVKASDESHAEVGDRANDGVRVNGNELRCKVVGEGGNLGLTQRGRIEFALAGGRIYTDAIDNSAGVDCSDHEVNIKILLGDVVAAGDMTDKQRNKLLAEMTDEVAGLVLRDNYLQTQAISIAAAKGHHHLESQARLMRSLERAGKLNRTLEELPDDETLAERQEDNLGLTAPEFSVLLAYVKMTLYETLLNADLPDDDYLATDLRRYFPRPLRRRFKTAINRHRLRREIIATSVTNSMVNRVGATFVNRVVEQHGFAPELIARAYTVTRDAFQLRRLWTKIEATDNVVASRVQIDMLLDIGRLVERCTLWYLRNRPQPIDIAATIDEFTPGIEALAETLRGVLGAGHWEALSQAAKRYADQGVPKDIAQRVANLDALASAPDICQTARRTGLDVAAVGNVYFDVGERLGLDWLRGTAAALVAASHWQRQAVTAIVDDLYGQQREITSAVLAGNGKKKAVDGAVARWIDANRPVVERTEQLLADLRRFDSHDLAMLTVANRQIRVLTAG